MKSMHEVNPYDSSNPTYLFVGFEEERDECVTGLQNDHSFAVLGGSRCGKSAFLYQLEQDIREYTKTEDSACLVPCYLDIQGFEPLTPATLFKQMYEVMVRQCQAPAWSADSDDGEYTAFLAHIEAAQSELDQRYGPEWIMVFLIDDLDAALFDLPDDQFFYDLRHLLTESVYCDHFRIVATGMKDMMSVIADNAPFDFLSLLYLRVLFHEEINDVILTGFPDGIGKKAARRLTRFTGGHPYLLQSLLEQIWQNDAEVDETEIKRAKKMFLKQPQVFHSWLNAFGMLEHYVYQWLIASEDNSVLLRDVYESLPSEIEAYVDDAIGVLGYHGVIDLSDPDAPQLAGTIFRDWYQDQSPVDDAGKLLDTFTALYEDVAHLPVDDDIRQTLWASLEEWLDEQPTDGEFTPSAEKALAAIEEIRRPPEAVKAWATQIESLDTAWHWG